MGFWVFASVAATIGLTAIALVRINMVVCPSCANNGASFMNRYKWKKDSLVHVQDNGFRDGWRTVSEQVQTDTTHFDNSGQKIGTSQGFTTVNRTVPCRTHYYTDFFVCPDCGVNWSRNRSHTYNL